MIELFKKLIGWFFPERVSFTAQGEEWQRIVRERARREKEQDREIKRLQHIILQVEARARNLQAELDMVKTKLYNIQMKEKLHAHDRGQG